MAGETTSVSLGVLYKNSKAKGTYRVYKPKTLKTLKRKNNAKK